MFHLNEKNTKNNYFQFKFIFSLPKQNLMLILSLFFTVVLMHIVKDISEQGVSVYQNPRFWVQILSMALITGITIFN